jgi:hypothetical protein
MAIRTLTVQEFDRFRSARAALARLTTHAIEWFADDGDLVLGAIAYHKFLLDWSYVVLGRDGSGFRPIACDTGLRDLAHARKSLMDRMAMALRLGDHVSSPHQPAA